MKKTFKIVLAAAILSIFNFEFSISFAQDAEYNLIRRTYTINDNGTIDIRFRKEIKLLRNRAITAYADKGETFILYNPAIDLLTINESYTIRKDGSHVETPQNAFIDQLPSQCENCGRYNGIRERAVIHTALEYDCIIVLDYTIHRKGTYLNEDIILSEDCPIKEYEIIVDAPKGSLFSFYSNDSKVKSINDEHYLHLVAKNLPQKYIDSYLPDPHILYPYAHIVYGSDPYKIVEMAIEPLPETENMLAELYDRDPLKYATNIRDYVTDYIHTTDFPLALVNYQVSPAKTTFLSGCGTTRDKEWLTVCMLRQAGFSAEDKESNGRISISVKENGQELPYTIQANDKRPARLDGAAIDEQRTITVVEDALPWSGTPIGGGYKQMTLPTEKGSIAIDPAQLTSARKAPLKVRNCNESYQYTILPPRTPKHLLVGKPVDINYTEKGVGSIRISIKQNAGGGIEVVRQLNINVENGIVTAKQYKAFRKMMQIWNQYNTITIKAQQGRPIN